MLLASVNLGEEISLVKADVDVENATYLKRLKEKYKVFAANQPITNNNNNTNNTNSKDASLPVKLQVSDSSTSDFLYDPSKICCSWPKSIPVGSGLYNLGNTCYINAVLQCLTHTAPLYNYFRREQHSEKCTYNGFCILCELHKHMMRAIDRSNSVIRPKAFVDKIHLASKAFSPGEQQDAHEFLRFCIDRMQQVCVKLHRLSSGKIIPKELKDTTAVDAIFKGELLNTIKCLNCNEVKHGRESFMDLQIDMKHDNLEAALGYFFRNETLSMDNTVDCEKCKSKQPISKRFRITSLPNVLTLHLKRYKFIVSMNTIAKLHNQQFEFKDSVDLKRYLSEPRQDVTTRYKLYGAVVHSGNSIHSGHYLAFAKSSNDQWHLCNDESVRPVSFNTVRSYSKDVYMLFFVKDDQSDAATHQYPKLIPVSSSTPYLAKPNGVSVIGQSVQSTGIKRTLTIERGNFSPSSGRLLMAGASALSNGATKDGQPPSKLQRVIGPQLPVAFRRPSVTSNSDRAGSHSSNQGTPSSSDQGSPANSENGSNNNATSSSRLASVLTSPSGTKYMASDDPQLMRKSNHEGADLAAHNAEIDRGKLSKRDKPHKFKFFPKRGGFSNNFNSQRGGFTNGDRHGRGGTHGYQPKMQGFTQNPFQNHRQWGGGGGGNHNRRNNRRFKDRRGY